MVRDMRRVQVIEKKYTRVKVQERSIIGALGQYLSDEVVDRFKGLIRLGLPPDQCAAFLCICERNYTKWLDRGQRYLDNPEDHPKDEIYGSFQMMVQQAKAEWQHNILTRSFQDEAVPHAQWIRDMTLLERRDRKNWGRSDRVARPNEMPPLPDEAYA